ncbi:MAG: ATP-binding protein [Lachnospiraceae bacterium]|nr:ATP-binding protein [Lachnospiraceae bacterium]
MRIEELLIYRELDINGLLYRMSCLIEGSADRQRSMWYESVHQLLEMAGQYGFSGNLWHCCLTHFLVNHENSYSRTCELRGAPEGSINQAVLQDMTIFWEWYHYDLRKLAGKLGIEASELILAYQGSRQGTEGYSVRMSSQIGELAVQMGQAASPEELKEILTGFYQKYGVGKLGLHKAFRIRHSREGMEIVPIVNIPAVHLEDLVGYQLAKEKLIRNTEAFVSGRKANNCLLFGDAGTGKSSSIKAIANEYYDRGLRIIEVYKHQLQELHEVIARIKNRNYKFILYMDDLSFEEFETDYKFLKAVIEGGLEKRPENVLIYATSNRRHLVKESFADKEGRRDQLHASDTVQEKLSLASRFGVTIFFEAPDQKLFQEIVRVLAERNGISMPEEELLLEANRWELSHGGLSGRTAQQFVDYLLGKDEKKQGDKAVH